jgi:hypothetical protein
LQPVQVLERVLLQLEQVLVRLQLEPGSQFVLHLVVLLHSLEFVPQLQCQELPGLQLEQHQKVRLVQQQEFVQPNLLGQVQDQLQRLECSSCFR